MRFRDCVVVLLMVFCLSGFCRAEESDLPEGEPGPFAGTRADAVISVVVFLIVLLALWKLAWNPILSTLHGREEYIAKQIHDAEDTSKESKAVLAEYQGKLANVREEGKKIIAEHTLLAEKKAKEIADKARYEAESIKLKTQIEIENAGRRARQELVSQAGDIVLRLGKEIFGRTIEDKDNAKLIGDAVERLKGEVSNKDQSQT